ncbi:MAG: UDP-3-O-(3-hydroxymyristoyl)glucosamine N-acyltransferase [Ignavibacteria bacterium]|nr:UDP-3-O-(3-hydroxymyristoyl)glucosamine N-acyltransferase [Ignavibacteria bacterium]
MRVTEIARLVKGEISGTGDPNAEIERVAKIEEAGPGDITFLANVKYKKYLITTSATAVLVALDTHNNELAGRKTPITLIRVSDPYNSFLRLIDHFHPPPTPLVAGTHPTAVVAQSATIGDGAAIGAYVVIGERCIVGQRTSIYHNTVIGDDAKIGIDTLLYANVTVRENCKIGDRVVVHSGAVIGSDGFGFAPKEDGTYEKIPQRGIVVIENDVEIGANCAIDRATIGETRIKCGVKLDNLIHIAHNVVIGEHTVIAAQTGISGSTKVGNHCALGGQVGLTGHIQLADNTTIGAQSGVPKSITEPGKTYMGYPAREIHESWKIDAAARQLPELLYEFRALKKRVEALEQLLHIHTPEQK